MTKILVTTDFSTNSKVALRFAIQLASQWEVTLTFLHVQPVMRPTTWSKSMNERYEHTEMTKAQTTLDHFVNSEYKSLNLSPPPHTCVVLNSALTDTVIKNYAADNHFDFICISTRGEGIFEKLVGTTTTNLINQSLVPVIAVPGRYRVAKLTHILYASDLSCIERELRQVVRFARPLAALVELLHFYLPSEPVTDPVIINTAVQTFSDYPVDVQLKPIDLTRTMIANLELAVKKAKPSMMVMFTTQNQGFFHQLFSSSNSVDYSFLTNVPLLIFRKV
jgi:nucleotide-binding universal stress UspA family protein